MRAVLLVAAKDVRQRFRDRSALVLGFAAPLLVSLLMATAFGGVDDLHADVAVVDEDGGEVAAALVEVLTGPELEELLTVEVRTRPEAAASVDDRDLDAALVVPAGFTDAVVAGREARLEVLANVDSPLSAAVTRSIAESFLGQVRAARIAAVTAAAAGADQDPAELARLAAERAAAIGVEEGDLGGRQLSMLSYYAPAMAIFFMLYAVGFAARGWFVEVGAGTLDRMGAAPLRPGTVLAGKALAVAAYAGASLATTAIVTAVAFGAHWGPPAAVAAVLAAMVVAVVAITAFVIACSRTPEQADGLASMITFGLAILGGNFVFLGAAPEAMRRAALATPNGWALRAVTDLSTGSAASAAVVPVLAILAISLAVAGAAAVVARRREAW